MSLPLVGAVTVLPSAEIASSTGVEKFASWEFASGISTVADGTIIASSTPARAPVAASRASKPNMAQAVNVPRRCAVLELVRGVQAIPMGVSGTMRLVLVVAFALGVRPRVSPPPLASHP